MPKLIIAVVSLSLALVGFRTVAFAQGRDAPVVMTNAEGTCLVSPSPGGPGANAGDWTITCGDINPGTGTTVIGPPSVNAPVALDTAPEPAPAPPAEPAPATEPAPETTAETAVATETDLDADNYADALEVEVGLDPNNPDTDGDSVADGDEIAIYGTDPLVADYDGDGITDGEELFGTHTDPLLWDDFSAGGQAVDQSTTQDVAQFTQETTAGGNEASLGQVTTETLTAEDGNAAALGTGNASSEPGRVTRGGVSGTSLLGPDGTYSVVEEAPPSISVGVPAPAPAPVAEPAPELVAETTVAETTETTVAPEPVVEAAAATETDLDADNYADSLEWDLGLDPNNADSDADGVADGDEITIYGTEPTVADTDGDGVIDGEELFGLQTDPLLWDDFSAATETVTG